MSAAARDAGIEALFEVRDEAELEGALEAGGELIGVNRRNLESLAMEPDVLERLLPARRQPAWPSPSGGIRLRRSRRGDPWGGTRGARGGALSTSAGASDAVRAGPGIRGRAVVEVKFCGMTRRDDVGPRVQLRAEYVGVIFTSSPRRVTPAQAATILQPTAGTAVFAASACSGTSRSRACCP